VTRTEIDAILETRARVLAQPLAHEEAVPSAELIQFSAGNERYAVEAQFVHRLERVGRVTPLPGAARHVAGLTNIHGQLVPVIDLRVLLGAAPSTTAPFAVVLGDQRAELGIVADELSELRILPIDQLAAPAPQRPIVRQVLADGTAIIDAAALLANPQLVAANAPTRYHEESR
jgi:purine-binding chemotaxis protein CheW